MANLFNLAANEMSSGSLYYLGSIFGPVGTVLPGSGGTALLGTMFRVFNTATLALGTIIVTYTTIISVVMTAHEGEMLGKKFHTLWIPLRTVFGISALVPTATGYSYLQMAMMWFIIQGVGAADTLWTTVYNYTATQPTAPSGPGGGAVDSGIRMQIGQLFQDLVCQAAVADPNNSDMLNLANGSPQVEGNTYKMGVSGECGAVGWSSPEGQNALQAIVPALGAVAAQFVAMNDSYTTYANSTLPVPPPVPTVSQNYCSGKSPCTPASVSTKFPPPSADHPNSNTITGLYWPYGIQPMAGDFINVTATLYSSMLAAGTQAGSSTSTGPTGNAAIDNGWIFAGAYYYDIAKANRHEAKVSVPSVQAPSDAGSLPSKAKIAYNASVTLIQTMQSQPSSTTSSTGPGNGIHINNFCMLGPLPVGPLCAAMIDGWTHALTGGDKNPVVAAQTFGTGLLMTIEIAFPILLVVSGVLAGVSNIIILGSGSPTTYLSIQIFIMAPLYFFALTFFVLGGTLAIYTPMIPYMLFAFGVINWLVATIETMIAAPIVAIGFLYPEGAHELWGKAEAAIMLILNIFLRPSLMIFGMMAGMLMSYVSITFLNQGFMYVVQSVAPEMGFLEAVLFMCLYTTIFVTMINKCFELVHIIPDKILRWIGGGNEQFGSGGQDLEKVASGFKSSQEATAGAMKGTQAGVEKHADARMKQKQKQKEGEQKDQTTGKPGAGSPPST